MFGDRMKIARVKAGMSQDEVAKAVGITQAYYSYIESGLKNPPISTVISIAETLHTSIDYLVELKTETA